jgi:membrane protease YdiL (CAAX protease family)
MQFSGPLFRVLGFWTSFIVILFVSGSALNFGLSGLWHRAVYGVIGTLAALLLTWLWSNRNRASLHEYGLLWRKGSGKRLLLGLLIGAGLILLMLAILLVFTPLQISPKNAQLSIELFLWLFSLILFAYLEELAFRGMPFVELNRKYGFFWAQFLVAFVFAVYHVNYGWSLQVAFMGPFVWSFIFGLARQYTNGIAMPTGIHIALNAGQVILGLQPGEASLFTLDIPEQITPAIQSRIDVTGMALQVAIAIVGILLTYRYHKRSSIIAA